MITQEKTKGNLRAMLDLPREVSLIKELEKDGTPALNFSKGGDYTYSIGVGVTKNGSFEAKGKAPYFILPIGKTLENLKDIDEERLVLKEIAGEELSYLNPRKAMRFDVYINGELCREAQIVPRKTLKITYSSPVHAKV